MFSSSTSPQWKHDVFVSFRGENMRDIFFRYLRLWLNQEGLSYLSCQEPEHGKKNEDEIFSAIHHTRVALIVLSENYANSKRCLNELVEILSWNREHENPVVIPVFYGVDPADVKNLRSESKFGQAFQRLRNEGRNGQQIPIWEKALRELEKFSGFESEKFRKESDLLDSIVQSLCEKICPSRFLNFAKNAIGADRLVDDVIPLLKIGQENVRVIGISGTEGIGKTMVARAVCKSTLREFEHFIFLDNVGEANSSNFLGLQKKLLQNLIKMNEQTSDYSFHGNIEMIKKNIRRKKILLALDGVTKKEQMENLGAEERELFRPGSRILITTRDQNLLKDLNVDDMYNVEGLNRDEAFRLFCRHAFEREEPKEDHEELSRYLAHYAGGHPSALEKWGSFLNKRSKDDWQIFSDELEKNPDRINSFMPDFQRIFLEYPCKVVGLCGGDRRTKTWKDKGYKGVRKIDVGFDSEGIRFIAVQYDRKGRSPKTVTRGTEGGETSTRTIELDYPEEYLIFMSGHTKEDSGRTILQSLTFHTNRGKRKSIGTDEEGRKFSFPYTGHKIVGFHGSCKGSHLESIEASYKRIAHTPIGYSLRVFGPFGGAGEKSWDSGDINGIFIRYADFITEINFEVRKKSPKPQTTYGENGWKNTFEVTLETPYECITSFSGYFENAYDGRILIKSLTFQTNKRILGPIGREEGKHFSSPSSSEAVKVIRFFGRTVDYLEFIGAQVKPYYPFKSVGLYGSSNESNWDDRNDDCTNVRKIIVEFAPSERFIRSITFHYELKNKRLWQPERHPGILAEVVEPFAIHIDADEYLTSVSGYYTDDGITSLVFGINKRMLEPIGREEGIHFSSPATGGKIVGFYGRSGKNLEAIGAYFELIPHLYPIKSIGPFGVLGGCVWDQEKFKGVRQIEVKHHIYIHYIKFVYDQNGSDQSCLVMNGCRAKGDYTKVTSVTLDYPWEYLTSISGYSQDGAIQSLTFHSNKGRHGPFGKEMGKYFWYPSNRSRITGFYGTRDPDNETLKSIGVYVELIPRMYPFKTVGPFGGSDGTPWDDGVHTDVRGFRISFGKAIKAIGIAYDNNGSFVSGSEHGIGYDNKGSFALGLKPGNKRTHKYEEVILDYPKERLILIWVWVGQDGNTSQIHDLQIVTTDNNQVYGPFISRTLSERNKLTRFRIPEEDGRRIIGFFGKTGRYLNSIGARLEPY